MAEDKLSGKAGLDTTEFKTGIAAMNRELRVLESGFRASAASLGDWANDATGLETRIKSLNSQLDIQRQKVAATRAEYERIKAEKGENSRAAQDLEIKLNKETETLGKMENELKTTEASLEEMRSTTSETEQSVQDLGDQTAETSGQLVSFQDVMDGVSQVGAFAIGTFVALVAAVAALALGIGTLVFNAADSAAAMVDLSTKTGISTERLQELSYIGDQVGTSLDTITGAQARLVRSMASAADGSDAQTEAFKNLGVSVKDANGELRDQQEVFGEVIDALGQIENPAERDALAMELFGKSAQELNPLIKAGSDELARLADEAHDVGAVMDGDAVAGLEAFDDTMASIQAGIKGMLGTLAVEFLPIFKEVAAALQELFKSEEFKAGVQEFTALIRGAVSVALEVLGQLLSGDFEGALGRIFGGDTAATIVGIFTVISNFIQNTLIPFVTVHAEEIKAALIAIGAALAAAGIISVIAGIVAAINPVTLVIAAIVAAIGLLAAAWTGNWFGIRDALTQVWEGFLMPVLTTLWTWLSTNIPLALQTLSAFWTGTLLPAIQGVWAFLNDFVFPLFSAIATFLDAVFGLALRTLAGIWQGVLLPPIQEIFGFLQDNIFPIFQEVSGFVSSTFQPTLEKFGSFLSGKLVKAFKAIGDAIGDVIGWLQDMAKMFDSIELPDWMTPGSPTPWENGLVGINKAMKELNQQLPILAQGLNIQPGMPLGLGAVDQSVSNSVQVIGNVIIRGDTTAGSLGAALQGRRY